MDIRIIFDSTDLEELCLAKLKGIETFAPGKFKASYATYTGVTCTFVPDSPAEEGEM